MPACRTFGLSDAAKEEHDEVDEYIEERIEEIEEDLLQLWEDLLLHVEAACPWLCASAASWHKLGRAVMGVLPRQLVKKHVQEAAELAAAGAHDAEGCAAALLRCCCEVAVLERLFEAQPTAAVLGRLLQALQACEGLEQEHQAWEKRGAAMLCQAFRGAMTDSTRVSIVKHLTSHGHWDFAAALLLPDVHTKLWKYGDDKLIQAPQAFVAAAVAAAQALALAGHVLLSGAEAAWPGESDGRTGQTRRAQLAVGAPGWRCCARTARHWWRSWGCRHHFRLRCSV